MKAGFVINPIAGMGGPVGLKGTDGIDAVEEAIDRGAARTAERRAIDSLQGIKSAELPIEFVTCSGIMGETALTAAGLEARVVCKSKPETDSADTRNCVARFIDEGAEIIIFVGGDGTARDVLSVVGSRLPILGVPAGVKMHSAVFLNTPQALSQVMESFLRSRLSEEADVMDIDEEAFREGRAISRLFGVARVPDDRVHMQTGKQSFVSGTADDEALELGRYIVDTMEPDITYIIGPGGTTAHVAKAMQSDKTLLGVDVYRDGYIVCHDASERDLEAIMASGRPARIIVSPIGSQGFLFGRGNQQISPEVIRRVGLENVIIICTPTKLLSTPVMRVDTGDASLDAQLRGSAKVVVGYKRRRLVRIL
ncbi:MAG: ATP-NAD kinase family protein [Candidatus Thermoplasmatota archaeon]|nr:ATP-NAD kinase family protein [Candidatus Thermoplasmatota archaeon]